MSAREAPVLRIAPPYDDALVRRIEEGFSKKLGTPVQFKVIEDSSLLSGFVAFVHGTVYDVSGKTQLANIGEHLLDSFIVPPAAVEEDDAS